MSSAEKETENSDTEDENVPSSSFIYPVAPKPTLENAEQIGINTTPAFQCIDEVCIFIHFLFVFYHNFMLTNFSFF